jgi:hypothetical protein
MQSNVVVGVVVVVVKAVAVAVAENGVHVGRWGTIE